MATIKERWRAFRQWQKQPYVVAPLSKEQHQCATCGTQYEGNYCPRCGQSARVGRYSFKNMIRLFLDVWGLGNRSMFRSIRDLILRPGYMIRDYLQGMQMAYFPPFKMFFLLTTFSLLISSGLNLKGENTIKEKGHHAEVTVREDANNDDSVESKATENVSEDDSVEGTVAENVPADDSIESKATENDAEDDSIESREAEILKGITGKIFDFHERFPAIFSLLSLSLLSVFLYVFVRKCPAIPDLRYSEFLVALVYTSNMYTLYIMALDFLCIDYGLSTLVLALTMVPLKQFSGFKWWKIILYIILAAILFIVTLIMAIAAGYVIIKYTT